MKTFVTRPFVSSLVSLFDDKKCTQSPQFSCLAEDERCRRKLSR